MGTDCCQTRFTFKLLGNYHAYDNTVEETRIRVSCLKYLFYNDTKTARTDLVMWAITLVF